MSGFISRAACRGRRPSSYAAYVAHERPTLIARLLKDRDVPRFIVAPNGYGKTSLALEYAETMFSWTHTFWVNASSPCFIRDLDAHDIASSCFALDGAAALVVFDDVPALEPDRMQAFSSEIDKLLEGACEVVVTCSPTCDTAGALQRDRIRLGARDLLLDDAELADIHAADNLAHRSSKFAAPVDRIPALVWATSEDAPYAFAKSALYEEMPSDLLLATASTLVLQRGSFADLSSFGLAEGQVLAEFLDDYPHLGFDADLDRFEAPALPLEALAAPLKNRLPELVARSCLNRADELVHAWANALVRLGQAGRACDVVREVCARRKRAPWLVDHVYELIRQACFYPTLRLARDRECSNGDTRLRLGAIEALCRLVLDDEEGSLRCAKRHAFDAAAPVDVRICSLLIVARLGKGVMEEKVREMLEAEVESASSDLSGRPLNWALLAEAWCVGTRSPSDLASLWGAYRDVGAGADVLCICASWLFGQLGDEDAVAACDCRAVERFVRKRLRDSPESGPDYFSASAGLAVEEAHNRGLRYDEGLLEAGVLMRLRQVEMNVLAQRRLFELDEQDRRARRGDWAATHPDSATVRDGELAAARRNVPVLTLRLFGRFEAVIGDEPIDPKLFTRQNSRTLLVLLAVNQGRELSREAVSRAMWPKSTEEVARKNFYTVWSNLRRALTLPDGTCPYLVRHQFGCSLEPRYVHSDVERLNEICRELLFGVPNIEQWSLLFAEVDRDFSADLMPAERKNRLIVQARNEYRTRLVDALVAATVSVVSADIPQWGIWFARAAIAHDDTREDAYVALMRAQIAGNQRTAAMMTYLRCRRVLSDQLGIDPSPETTLLYESLLDSD